MCQGSIVSYGCWGQVFYRLVGQPLYSNFYPLALFFGWGRIEGCQEVVVVWDTVLAHELLEGTLGSCAEGDHSAARVHCWVLAARACLLGYKPSQGARGLLRLRTPEATHQLVYRPGA